MFYWKSPIEQMLIWSRPQVSVNNMSTIGSVWSPRRESLLQDPIPELMTHITTDMEVLIVF